MTTEQTRWMDRLPLAGQATQLVETLQQQRQTLEQRGQALAVKLSRELELRRDALADRVVQDTLGRALSLGAHVLGSLGERIQEVHSRWPIQWDKIDQGARRITERADVLAQRRAALERPAIADYDALNVAQVHAALDRLSRYELTKLAEYERAHKGRVTVLREVERRLNAD